MTLWDELTPEECQVMETALEESYLNGVIADYLGHAEAGGAVWIFSSDEAAIRALIPRFTAVVADMTKRGLVEIREPMDMVWDQAAPMSDADIHEALTDPATWIWNADGDNRMVMLMTTDRADALLGRRPGT